MHLQYLNILFLVPFMINPILGAPCHDRACIKPTTLVARGRLKVAGTKEIVYGRDFVNEMKQRKQAWDAKREAKRVEPADKRVARLVSEAQVDPKVGVYSDHKCKLREIRRLKFIVLIKASFRF